MLKKLEPNYKHVYQTYKFDGCRMTTCEFVRVQYFPVWLRLKKEIQRQRRVPRNFERLKPIRYGYSTPYRVSLRYGAFIELD